MNIFAEKCANVHLAQNITKITLLYFGPSSKLQLAIPDPVAIFSPVATAELLINYYFFVCPTLRIRKWINTRLLHLAADAPPILTAADNNHKRWNYIAFPLFLSAHVFLSLSVEGKLWNSPSATFCSRKPWSRWTLFWAGYFFHVHRVHK